MRPTNGGSWEFNHVQPESPVLSGANFSSFLLKRNPMRRSQTQVLSFRPVILPQRSISHLLRNSPRQKGAQFPSMYTMIYDDIGWWWHGAFNLFPFLFKEDNAQLISIDSFRMGWSTVEATRDTQSLDGLRHWSLFGRWKWLQALTYIYNYIYIIGYHCTSITLIA